MQDIIGTVVYGIVSVFVISIIAIVAFWMIGDNLHPILSDVANKTNAGNVSGIDVDENLDFGMDMFYIAMFILIAAPFLLILVKYFYEREARTF